MKLSKNKNQKKVCLLIISETCINSEKDLSLLITGAWVQSPHPSLYTKHELNSPVEDHLWTLTVDNFPTSEENCLDISIREARVD